MIFLFKYNIKNALLPLEQPTTNIFGYTGPMFLQKKNFFHRNIEIFFYWVQPALDIFVCMIVFPANQFATNPLRQDMKNE
jgi:hypothetical protein